MEKSTFSKALEKLSGKVVKRVGDVPYEGHFDQETLHEILDRYSTSSDRALKLLDNCIQEDRRTGDRTDAVENFQKAVIQLDEKTGAGLGESILVSGVTGGMSEFDVLRRAKIRGYDVNKFSEDREKNEVLAKGVTQTLLGSEALAKARELEFVPRGDVLTKAGDLVKDNSHELWERRAEQREKALAAAHRGQSDQSVGVGEMPAIGKSVSIGRSTSDSAR